MNRSSKTQQQTALDAEHDEPLLQQPNNSNDPDDAEDIELAHLDGGERTPISHYLQRETPPKQTISVLWIAVTLAACVLGFTINTEATAYVEDSLGWKKPFATMYITHSSLCLPWICHILYLWFRSRRKPPHENWIVQYSDRLRHSISSIESYSKSAQSLATKDRGPFAFLAKTMAFVTIILTASGCSWFLSLSLTTPADLTAIYNCSTFFAAAFSVPLLKEKLGWLSIAAVAISIAGTFTIAYGDTTASHSEDEVFGTNRLLGNIIACGGAVAFGLYEVLFKKWACAEEGGGEEGSDALTLTLAASALTGFYTAVVGWLGLLLLHIFRVETFVIPGFYTSMWLVVAVLSGSMGITLLVLLVIWTDPVFGSMANVLSVFFVALADWVVWGLRPSMATYAGGVLIFIAFGGLGWDSLYGKKEHGAK